MQLKDVIMEDVNRIKLVLVEKKRTSKWLSEQMGVNPSTVSKWCTNTSQPDIASLLKIADLLDVDIKELIVRQYKAYILSQTKPNSAITVFVSRIYFCKNIKICQRIRML